MHAIHAACSGSSSSSSGVVCARSKIDSTAASHNNVERPLTQIHIVGNYILIRFPPFIFSP